MEFGKTVRVLVVDDIEQNRMIMAGFCEAMGYECALTCDGNEALAALATQPFDIVLLDVIMPGKDGVQTLREIKADRRFHSIPVLMISALDDLEEVVEYIELGADDYLTKPFKPALLKARVSSSLEKKYWHDQSTLHIKEIERMNAGLNRQVAIQTHQLWSAQQATIFAMAKLAEFRDLETGEHITRMAEYSRALAVQLAKSAKYSSILTGDYILAIFEASPLHDIGKVAIPDRLLLKPAKLTPEEFEIMKTHAGIGAKMLRGVEKQFPGNRFIQVGISISGCHHEKWDGSGYPDGLKGDNIPLEARILGLADVYDALVSKRVYKDAFSHEKAKQIILEGRGNAFDPRVVDAFLEIEPEFINTRRKYQDF